MKRIALLFIVVLSLLLSGCSTARKTTTTNTQAEAQLTATAQEGHHAEATEKAAVITNVTTDERRNVVIDFTTVEFYPGGVPSLPSDTTAPDWLKDVIAFNNEDGNKAKPPNVKSITKGRAVIEDDKNEQSRTEAQAERSTTEDDAVKEDIKADTKEATDTKTDEKLKFTFWDWLYIAVVGAFCIYAIIVGVRIAAKLHRAAKGKDNGPG